jgi:coenzyme F420-0:L-glutamate ligase/coenzyme F420-1:gamma-L-glutamate ligase
MKKLGRSIRSVSDASVGEMGDYRVSTIHPLSIWPIVGMPEVSAGDDLTELLIDALGMSLRDGDIVTVTSKIVSKAEGRVERSEMRDWAIENETVRVVAERQREGHWLRIVENKLGLVMAAAGIDSSNAPNNTIILLPRDPDDSARRLRREFAERVGVIVGIVVTDTVGRPWRRGTTDIAIGAAGIMPTEDFREMPDDFGRTIHSTVLAIADEIASASNLVCGKINRVPASLIRGGSRWVLDDDGPGAQALIRGAEDDMFRQGSMDEG